MSLFISPHVNHHHHHPSSSSSATDSLVARVHTQLYLSIESNRKICRLQLGRLSIRKTTETMKPKSSPSPLQDEGSGLGRSKPEWTGDVVSSPGSGTLWGLGVTLLTTWLLVKTQCRFSQSAPGLELGLDTRPSSTPVFLIIFRGVKPPHYGSPRPRVATATSRGPVQRACDDNAQLWSHGPITGALNNDPAGSLAWRRPDRRRQKDKEKRERQLA